jgi:hypothetical protein
VSMEGSIGVSRGVEGDLAERTGEEGGGVEGSVGGMTSMIESVDSSPTDSNDDCLESVSKINIPSQKKRGV